MPRFFFHLLGDDGLTEDFEGGVFVDLKTARVEAIKAAKDLIAESLRGGHSLKRSFSQAFVVVDEFEQSQVDLPFEEAAFVEGYKP